MTKYSPTELVETLGSGLLSFPVTHFDADLQFDEPAFTVFFDEVQDWGVAALERAAEGLRIETAVHICYGYGIKANTDWKATLGSEWRQYEESLPLLQQSSLDIVSLESHHSHVPMELIELVRGKKVDRALAELEFSRKRISGTVRKTLESAIANAENNHDLDVDSLVVAEAFVGKSMVMKRFHARGRGRASRIEKPFAHLTIVVREVEAKGEAA